MAGFFGRHFLKRGLALLILVFIIASLRLYRPNIEDGSYFVKRIVDGDTILLANGRRVRYIGINTPETKHPYKGIEHMGEEASLYNKKLVGQKWVRLEFDIEKIDKHDRLLAYVYQGDTFVNAELVRNGYAEVYFIPPNIKYQELFFRLQRQARENKRGLWKERSP